MISLVARFTVSTALAVSLAACAAGRTTMAQYPGEPAAFDRAGSDPKAVEIADNVFATAGGPGHWDHVQQLRWKQTIQTTDGKVEVSGEQAWDRWNARHWGLLHREDGDVAVGYELYGDFVAGYAQRGEHAKVALDSETRAHALDIAKKHFNIDTARIALQFVMLDPGAKLTYKGKTGDDAGDDAADDIQIDFADPARKGVVVHAIVDRATTQLARIEMIEGAVKTGFTITGWTDIDGMKFATAFKDLGSPHTIAIADLKVSAPDDELFVVPLAR